MKKMSKDMSNKFWDISFLLILVTGLILSSANFIWASDNLKAKSVRFSEELTSINVIDEGQAGIVFELNIGNLEFIPVTTKGGTFILTRAEGLSRSHVVGEPNLPTANRLVAIPFGASLSAEVLSYTTEEVSLDDLEIDFPLMPVQPSLSKSASAENAVFEFNDALYETDQFYALPRVTTEVLGVMRSVRLARIVVSPIEYNPVQKKLRVYRQMTVRVTFQNADWDKTYSTKSNYYSPYFEVINNQVDGYSLETGVETDITRYPVKYVIISDRIFESQLQPFIEWKTKKGFTVVTAYTDDIGDTSYEIKSYLDSLYQAGTPGDPAPSFVLLVGDDAEIPAHSVNGHKSDFPYVEYTDDYLPEAYCGRFSASNTTQLQPQIDKTLEYECYLMPDPSYLDEVTLVSGVDSYNAVTYGNGQINYGTTQYFNIAHGIDPHVWLYPDSDENDVSDSVFATINDGIGFMNYTAHCGHAGWSNPSFSTYHIDNELTNAHKYLLSIANCCQSNTFGTDFSTACFGEVWLRAEDKGGIGHIGATADTYWDEDYYWAVGYGPIIGSGPTYEQTGLGAFDGSFHDHSEPVTEYYVSNGAIVSAGNLAVAESGSLRTEYYWEVYTLMGDPSVMTYWGVPAENTVSYPEAVSVVDAFVPVSADPGSYVGFTVNGQLHGKGYIDATGSADIPIDVPFTGQGTADIVVTAQNRQPYTSTITVSPVIEPYMVYESHTIDDLAGGNGNGEAEPGEDIVLGLEIQNLGGAEAIDVEVILSTSDAHVTLTDSSALYPSVLPNNGTATISDAFAFGLDPNIPDGYEIQFSLKFTDSSLREWTDDFSIIVKAAVLEFQIVEINDPSGNNDGFADPGETVELIITLNNSGTGQADNISSGLAEDHDFITVVDGDGYFGTIAGLQSANNTTNPFAITIDPDCPLGAHVQFELSLTGDFGYSELVPFTLVVGQRIDFHYDNFAFDLGWSGLDGPAEWQIEPAAGGIGTDGVGHHDPEADVSPTGDNHVLGNDLGAGLNGDYTPGLSTRYFVTSPTIDCSEFNGIILSFYRWLGIEAKGLDLASLEAFDGVDWIIIFETGTETIDDGSWVFQDYDVSAVADSNPDFKIRFGIGHTNAYNNYCGWNIDDILLKGYGMLASGEISFNVYPLTDSLVSNEIVFDTVIITNLDADDTLYMQYNPAVETWLSCTLEPIAIEPFGEYSLEVQIDATDLEPGDYVGTLPFVSNDYRQKVGGILIDLYIYSPQIVLNPVQVIKCIEPGTLYQVPLAIANTGLGLLEFDAVAEVITEPKSDWLILSQTKGEVQPGSTDTITITLDAGSLVTGEYIGQVILTTNDQQYPEKIVPVTLKVIVCGDANGDENVNISDVVFIINRIFHNGPAPTPPESGDANGDGFVNIADAVYLVNLVFKGGPTPICP